jgi:colicin import membrane protein
MKVASTISACAHAAVLLWGLVSFSTKALETPPQDSMPVDIISNKEFSELRAGAQKAPKETPPKPLVEKVAEKKAVENPTAKVVEKQQEVVASAEAPSPPPEPKPPETKPPEPPKAAAPPKKEKEAEHKEPKPDPIAEAIKKEERKESKPDPIAEALKKEEAKKPEPKKAEVKPTPPKKPAQKPEQKFDADRIAALLDKRAPQRLAATGDVINHTLAYGARTGDAPQLTQTEIDAFREKLKSCWSPPAGAPKADKITVPITIRLRPDRTLAAAPEVEMSARDAYTQAMIDSAVRAIIECQPYTMFSPARYETWKEIPLDFDPAEMFRG